MSGLDRLRAGFAGSLLTASEDDYESARRVWNGTIDRRPRVIAQCRSADDVRLALEFGQSEGLAIAIRGGGHSYAGHSVCDDGIVIDLGKYMTSGSVDAASSRARVEAGMLFRDLDGLTQAHGLATTGGVVSHTGIAGLTLGGGIGWLMRKHGLTCDNLLSADVVTVTGEPVHASPDENPDLFWALRGGGGNFGVVTHFEYALHPVALVPVIFAFFDAADGRRALELYRDWCATAPDEVTSFLAYMPAPPAPVVPHELVGRLGYAVLAASMATWDETDTIMSPLRRFPNLLVNAMMPLPYPFLQGMVEGREPHGSLVYQRSVYTDGLPDAVIDIVLEACERMPSPRSTINIHQLGGAVARVAEDATAYSHRSAQFLIEVLGGWTAAGDGSREIEWARATHATVAAAASGADYANFSSDTLGGESVFGAAKERRLAEIKARYDPENVLRLNHNIEPASVTRPA